MRFHLFERRLDAHVRKAREYLMEANLARVEHQAAAEHHAALARMYAERVARLEQEVTKALQPISMAGSDARADDDEPGFGDTVLFPVPIRGGRS
ncbi:hypothetical protein [Imbroritus primus]|uniref:hypothetical protein n=1 Tax=Imbroritus primus TaxID=3058603 RepID=UPI0002696811